MKSTSARAFTFYCGTNKPSWLWGRNNTSPLFISIRSFRRHKTYRPATIDWACDSGGFTELSRYGRWETTPQKYVGELRRLVSECGRMRWASQQDWMCEPHMLAKTGATVQQHQSRSTNNFLELRNLAPDLLIIPVLQGWHPDDYLRHVDLYIKMGVDLRHEPTVGIGSVCRRAHVRGMKQTVERISAAGVNLHGFGLKVTGLQLFRTALVSSDSMAWSFRARAAGWDGHYLCGTPHATAKSCGDCHTWAMKWASQVERTQQTAVELVPQS